MPVSVSIEPFSPRIDMYDAPDPASAYSLSGHIIISLTPSSSLLGRPLPQNLLLTALELTFEGQSELVLTDVGYTPLRLISLTKQLVSKHSPIRIALDADADADAEWRVVFDIAVPGWLPQTAFFGDDDNHAAGVSYALYARARFLSANSDSTSAPASTTTDVWSTLCAAVRRAPNRPRAVHADPVPIIVTRFVSPPNNPACAFPRAAYAVQAIPAPDPAAPSQTNIPADILRGFQLHAIVPTRTPIADSAVPLVLRMRVPDPTRAALRILSFEADIFQVDSFRTTPPQSYAAFSLLPPPTRQPPTVPLKSPHPISALFTVGLVGPPDPDTHASREQTLIPPSAPKLFRVRGADTRTHGVPLSDAWLRMAVQVPVMRGRADPTEDTPLRAVRHEMRVRVTLGYDPDGDPDDGEESVATVSDELTFSVPLDLVRMGAPPGVGPAFLSALSSAQSQSQLELALRSESTMSLPLSRASTPYTGGAARSAPGSRAASPVPMLPPLPLGEPLRFPPALPAYSQLFHENGDRKEERGALPLYREKEGEQEEEERGRRRGGEVEPGSPSSSGSSEGDGEVGTPPDSPEPESGRGKFGESFLAFDEDDDGDGEDVQYGIAI